MKENESFALVKKSIYPVTYKYTYLTYSWIQNTLHKSDNRRTVQYC